MSKSSLFASLLAVLFASGCATLFQGNHEEIMVASDPAGAQVSVNDGRNGTTPYTMKVGRDDDLDIHVSKPGYAPIDIADQSHIEWGYFVSDIFFTGLIGLAVDGIDGAMFYHNQTMVSAHLEPITVPYAQSDQPSPQPGSRPATTVPAVASAPAVATFAAIAPAAPVANPAQSQTTLRPPTPAVTAAAPALAVTTVPATPPRAPVVDPQVGDQWKSSDHPE